MNKYQVDVPEGISGEWEIKKRTVTGNEVNNVISFYKTGRYVPSGTYTYLFYNKETIMSDTPDEVRDHMEIINKSSGNILIAGLGIGMVLNACASKEDVTHITVVEISEDVIKLAADHYLKKYPEKITIIQADIFEWKPPKGEFYDYAWYDIWPDICSDNLVGMRKLHRKFGRKAGWQGSWCRYICEKQERERKRQNSWRY